MNPAIGIDVPVCVNTHLVMNCGNLLNGLVICV